MRRARRGFTLLEMLGVISIILILMALAVIGFETLDRSASGKQTRVMLNDCTAMLNEFEAGSGGNITALGGNLAQSPQMPYPGGTSNGSIGTNPTGQYLGEVTNMAITTVPTTTTYRYDRYGSAVQNTWYMMAYLMRNPKVKQMVQNLPQNRVLTISSSGTTVPWYPWYGSGAPTGFTADSGVVLLDGWGNPIIFVPSNGIDVWKKGQPSPTLIQSRDQQPFFASAGPDGDFGADYVPSSVSPSPTTDYNTTDNWASPAAQMGVTRTPMGDDNIYSFENGQ